MLQNQAATEDWRDDWTAEEDKRGETRAPKKGDRTRRQAEPQRLSRHGGCGAGQRGAYSN